MKWSDDEEEQNKLIYNKVMEIPLEQPCTASQDDILNILRPEDNYQEAGWWLCCECDYIGQGKDHNHTQQLKMPRYTSDRNAAQLVIVKMRNQLFSRRRFFLEKLQEIVTATMTDWDVDRNQIAWPDVYWFVTPEIICKAALLTMDIEIEW